VQSIQSVIVGTDVSVASLQSQIAAIKAKTDALPADTAATLNQIKANIGSGPLNRMFTKSLFLVSERQAVVCTSSGPFLLHVAVNGGGLIVASVNGAGYSKFTNSHEGATFVIGGNLGEEINIEAEETAGMGMPILITMQTTEGAIVRCDEI
jgi:hypothetical protein